MFHLIKPQYIPLIYFYILYTYRDYSGTSQMKRCIPVNIYDLIRS